MLLKLIQAGHPILRRKARALSKKELETKEIQQLIDHMIATLRDAPGVGLAAPQVGEPRQIIIIEDKAKYSKQVPSKIKTEQNRKPIKLTVLINPQIDILDHETATYFEGCLSVDGYAAAVSRSKKVKVTALDRNGTNITYVANGWQARILQHEIDHLNGKLYIDTMIAKSFMTIKNFNISWRDASQSKIIKAFNN